MLDKIVSFLFASHFFFAIFLLAVEFVDSFYKKHLKPFWFLGGFLFFIVCSCLLLSCGNHKSDEEIKKEFEAFPTVKNEITELQIKRDKKQDSIRISLGDWSYRETRDEMTEAVSYYAELLSINAEQVSSYGDKKNSLDFTIRCSGRRDEILLYVADGFFASTYSYDNILIKFDDEKPFSVGIEKAGSGSHSILFLNSAKKLIGKIKKSKTMKIEVHFHNVGKTVFDFNIDKFNEAKLNQKK